MFNTQFKANIKSASIHDVAKKMQLAGFDGEHFKDNAKAALVKAGYQKAAADRIVKGQKMDIKDLKKVFTTLRHGKVITTDSGAVTSFVKHETNRQKGIYQLNLRTRADEIEQEKQAENAKTTKKGGLEKKKSSPVSPSSSEAGSLGQKVELRHSDSLATRNDEQSNQIVIPAKANNLANKPDAEIELMRKSAENNDMEIG